MRQILLLSFLFFSFFTGFGQCPPSVGSFNSQAEIDQFIIDYPNCTEFTNELDISGADIIDLTPFSNLISVEGLSIRNTENLISLEGLEGLESIEGSGDFFSISNNLALPNLDALSNLQTINTSSFDISHNDSLTNLDGLQNATMNIVSGTIFDITYNPLLENVNGLIGLEPASVSEFNIIGNDLLASFTGLSNATFSAFSVNIFLNNSLTSTEGLTLSGPLELLFIDNNDQLETITGFQNITAEIVDFSISNNAVLQHVDEFTNASLSADAVVNVASNPQLASCNLFILCEFLSGGYDEGLVFIGNNAQGCNTPEEVQDVCDDCPLEEVILNSQADVDAFVAQYPDCTKVYGLSIEGADISDLSGLSNLQEIVGELSISNTQNLDNLNGFNNVITAQSLELFNNTNLISLEGLNALQNVQNSITILQNDSLTIINNLESLTYASALNIDENLSLISLEGLTNVDFLNLSVSGNPNLTSLLGLEGASLINGIINIADNNQLVDLNGLQNLQEVGELFLNNNPSLISTQGFGPSLIGGLFINDNDLLQNLTGLENITCSAEDYEIVIEIVNNPLLDDISGLNNIDQLCVNQMVISGNSLLATCTNDFICSYIADETNTFTISNNAAGCNTVEEVDQACRPCDFPVVLTSQEEVDNFPVLYADCSVELLNGLTISGADIVDLSPLSTITTIEGGLFVTNNLILESLAGLESLLSVENVEISNNESLTNLEGLGQFADAIDIIITDNQSLSSLVGFPTLDSSQTSVTIQANPLLTTMEGMAGLISLFDLSIVDNDGLTNLNGLESFELLEMSLFISDNDNLQSLDGLNNLTSATAGEVVGLSIFGNTVLEDISALQNMTSSVIVALQIANNPQLATCDNTVICDFLSNTVDGEIQIENNAPGCNSIEEVNMACRPCDFPVVLTSQEEVNNFPVIYADCSVELLNGLTISGDDIVDLSPLSSVESVSGILLIEENFLLESLDGLNSLVYVDTMILNGNSQLVDLTTFSLELVIDNLEITSNNSLVNLSGFENVTSINNIILAFNEALVSVEGFPITQTSIGLFELFENPQITNLQGLTNLETATDIHIIGNNSIVNLSGLEGLNLLEISLVVSENLSLESFEGLDNLVSDLIQPSVEISITNNSLLEDISQLGDMISTSLIFLQIEGNTELAICSNVALCNYLNSGGDASISGNSEGCNSPEEVLDSCDFDLNKIVGAIGYDFNNDGCDTSDYDVSNILVTTTNDDTTFSSITDANGYFELFVNDGNYISEVVEASLPNGFNGSPSSITSEFVGLGNEDEIQFCVFGDPDIQDVSVSLIPLQLPRPGEDASYIIQFENKGAQVMSGDITFEYDDTIMFYTDSEVEPDSNEEGVLVWEYSNLLPFESRTFVTSFELFIPPVVVGGEELNSVITITPLDTDIDISDNTVALKETVVNSYDPNDKQVLQGEEIFEEQVGDYLDYVLRFQNTGTADALNVVVTDTLSDNLDWNTLRILSASHEYRVEITNENEVAFIFEDINLPPEEVDEEGSNGHIAFEIRTVDDLIIGDSVENTANIFFDFNPPIITNTVVTTVAEPLNVNRFVDEKIAIYPNPVSNRLTVQLEYSSTLPQISLVSLQGKVVARTETSNIDTSKLSVGIYFLRIETEEGLFIKKIIKR